MIGKKVDNHGERVATSPAKVATDRANNIKCPLATGNVAVKDERQELSDFGQIVPEVAGPRKRQERREAHLGEL